MPAPNNNQNNKKTDTPKQEAAQSTVPPQSRDSRKLRNFYNFQISAEKFENLTKLPPKMMWKYFRNGIIFGFLVEAMIVNTRVYDNIIRKSTIRRLDAKKLEDETLIEKAAKQQHHNTGAATGASL